jgi:hypothetical protein
MHNVFTLDHNTKISTWIDEISWYIEKWFVKDYSRAGIDCITIKSWFYIAENKTIQKKNKEDYILPIHKKI